MSKSTGPMHVTHAQWQDIREHYEDPGGEDDHLESAYEDQVNGGVDYDDYHSQFDYEPSPYNGDYSEE